MTILRCVIFRFSEKEKKGKEERKEMQRELKRGRQTVRVGERGEFIK